MLKKQMMAVAIAAALLLGACQNPPVKNVVEAPLGAPQGVTLDQVRQAILFAGNKRGWQMRRDAPGKIVASHQRSGHMAVVDILYTTTTFSVVYLESVHLQYDAEDKTVHPTYNRWIDFLVQDIQANAAALATDVGGGAATPQPPAGTTPDATGPIPLAPAPDEAAPTTDGAPPTDGTAAATGTAL